MELKDVEGASSADGAEAGSHAGTEERIVELEMRCAFLARDLDEYRSVLDGLALELRATQERMRSLEEKTAHAEVEIGPQLEKPPHY